MNGFNGMVKFFSFLLIFFSFGFQHRFVRACFLLLILRLQSHCILSMEKYYSKCRTWPKRQREKGEKKTVTIFHVWLLYWNNSSLFSVFDVIVFAPPGVRIDCHIRIRLFVVVGLWFLTKLPSIARIPPDRWMTFRNGQIKRNMPKPMDFGHRISTTKLLYLSSICIVYTLCHCKNHSVGSMLLRESVSKVVHTEIPTYSHSGQLWLGRQWEDTIHFWMNIVFPTDTRQT